jgi:excisionase family DNA binding protein
MNGFPVVRSVGRSLKFEAPMKKSKPLTEQLANLLSVEEAAVLAGGSRGIIERAVRAGELERVRLGRHCVRYKRDAVLAWLGRHSTRSS